MRKVVEIWETIPKMKIPERLPRISSRELLNKDFAILEIGFFRYNDSNRVWATILRPDGNRYVWFTGGQVLLKQLEELKNQIPLRVSLGEKKTEKGRRYYFLQPPNEG